MVKTTWYYARLKWTSCVPSFNTRNNLMMCHATLHMMAMRSVWLFAVQSDSGPSVLYHVN
jgi:hypothetical protein